MAFKDKRTGQWAVNPWINGKHVYRTLNPKNLQEVGMDPSPLTGEDKSLADRVGAEYIRRFRGQNATQENITKPATMLSTVIKNFLEMRTAKDNTRAKLVLDKFLRLVGDRSIRNLTTEELDRFRKSVAESTKAKSLFTHFVYLKELNYFLKWALDAKYINDYQFAHYLKLRKPKIVPVYLSKDEVTQLLTAVKDTLLEKPVRLILNTGCRRGELIRLKWVHINFEKKEIMIDGTKTFYAHRIVPLLGNMAMYLNTLPRNGEYVLSTADNKPLSKSALSSALRRFKAKQKLPFEWDFQTLRKTYGATLLMCNYKMETISSFLGHSDIRITQQWYVRLTASDVLKTMPADTFEGF